MYAENERRRMNRMTLHKFIIVVAYNYIHISVIQYTQNKINFSRSRSAVLTQHLHPLSAGITHKSDAFLGQ